MRSLNGFILSLSKDVGRACFDTLSMIKERRRLAQIPSQLAQDLEILVGALRSGSSLLQAIQVAAKEGQPPLAQEWDRLIQEVRLGTSLGEAFQGMEKRVPLAAIRSLVIAVRVTQAMGGNLAGVLATLARTLRQEISFQGKLKALTAQGKLSGYVVSAVPFFLLGMLYAIAPELIQPLFRTGVGLLLLLAVIVLVAIGTVIIQRIVTIEV